MASSSSQHVHVSWADVLLWVGAVVSGGLTLWFSLWAVPAGTGSFPGADKVEHAIAFFTTTLLFLLAAVWRPGRGPGPFYRWRRWLAAAVILLGGMVEIAQSALTASRKAEWLDWFSEMAAVLAAAGIVRALERRASAARARC